MNHRKSLMQIILPRTIILEPTVSSKVTGHRDENGIICQSAQGPVCQNMYSVPKPKKKQNLRNQTRPRLYCETQIHLVIDQQICSTT